MTQERAPTRVRPRPQFRSVSVSRAERLTPNLVRVRVEGPELEGFTPNGPAEHIRVWFPQAGYEAPVLPEWGPEGPAMPEGVERPISRVYTPRRWDAEARALDIDIVLHEGEAGPGAAWAMTAKQGDKVVVTGPGGPYRMSSAAAWYVLAADHAGLPAVATILEALPASVHATVILEVPDPADELEFESAVPADVTWVHTGSAEAGKALEAAIRDLQLPSLEGRVFVACEATVMRDIKRHLLFERGLSRDAVHAHGYWKRGEANHPDHDLGQDV